MRHRAATSLKHLMPGPVTLLVFSVLTITFLATGCYDEETATPTAEPTVSPTATPTGTPTPTPTATPASPTPTQGEVLEVTVLLKDNFFDPKDLTVPVNTRVLIIAQNVGQNIHNMRVQSIPTEGKEFVSDIIVTPGTESRFEAFFTKTGIVPFQCDYHVPDMVGTITVQ